MKKDIHITLTAEAIASAKKLEEKAAKAIVASQRILSGASDAVIEQKAAELLNLTDQTLDAMLKCQEKLARLKEADDGDTHSNS